jgi:hypothetical protein
MSLLRGPISRLRFSPYTSTAAMLGATSGRSRRLLHHSLA